MSTNNNINENDRLDHEAEEDLDALLGTTLHKAPVPIAPPRHIDTNLFTQPIIAQEYGSPTADQLVDDALAAGSPRSMAGDDEDRAFDEIVNGPSAPTAVTINTTTATDENNHKQVSQTQQQQQQPQSSFSSPTTLNNNNNNNSIMDDLSITEEERLLQSIVSSLDETQGVLGEISADTHQVESALEAAIRNAVSGKSSLQAGHTVVQVKELHGVVTELRNAKSSVGQVSCVTCQEAPNLTSQRLSLLVGTTSSLVLLFDTRQKLLGVCGTVADAKGEVSALDSSSDGATFVAGYARLSIIIWNAETLEPIRTIQNEASSMPFALSFFRPDHEKFFSLTREELRFFSTAKIMGKLIFRSSRFEGLEAYKMMQSHSGGVADFKNNNNNNKPMIRLSDAACATLPDPTSPPGSTDLRYYFALTTHQELIIGSVDFGVATTKPKVEYRRDLRMQMSLVDFPVSSSTTFGSGRNFNSSSLQQSSSSSSSPTSSSSPSSLLNNVGALVQWRQRKLSSSLSLFVTDGTSFETYALIQTQNDTSVSIVQLNRMEIPNPIRTLNCLDAGCALLGDVTEYLHVVDPATSKVIESVQGSAGFDLVRRGGPHQVHGSYTDSGGATFFCSHDRVVCCNVLSWEARVEALIFLKRWSDALDLTEQFICSDDVTAVGLVDEKGMKNTESVRAYAEQTLVPALLTDGLRNPGGFTKLMDDTVKFCHAVQLLPQCLPEMLMFCKTIGNEANFFYSLEELLSKTDCTGIPESILVSFSQFFAISSSSNLSDQEKQTEERILNERKLYREKQQSQSQSNNNNNLPSSISDVNMFEQNNNNNNNNQQSSPSSSSRLERLERCLMHVVGSDEIILKLAKQYKLWHAVMVVWSVRRQRPDVVIIELSGVADVALVQYLSCIIDGLTPDGATEAENAIDARRKIIAVLAAQPSALRRVAAIIPGFFDVMKRAMRIDNLWRHDSAAAIPRHLGPVSPACDKSSFFLKLDQAIEANNQIQLQQQQQQPALGSPSPSSVAEQKQKVANMMNQFMLMWSKEVACGNANISDPETFFSRVLLHCSNHLHTTTTSTTSTSTSLTKEQKELALQVNKESKEQLQNILCDLLIQSPSFQKAKLNDLEKQLLRVSLPKVHATLLVRQNRYKDALEIFFEHYQQQQQQQQLLQQQQQQNTTNLAQKTINQNQNHYNEVGDIFQFMELTLEIISNISIHNNSNNEESSSSSSTSSIKIFRQKRKEEFTQIVKESIPRLIGVNSSKLARFVSSYMNELQPFVLQSLPRDSKEQCEFLKEFLDRQYQLSSSNSSSNSSSSSQQQQQQQLLTPTNKRMLQTRLLILMCQFDSDSLYNYLVERDSYIEFDIEPVLRAAQHHNITEACAFLYEKTCQIFEAMKLLIQALAKSIQEHWVYEKQKIQQQQQQQQSQSQISETTVDSSSSSYLTREYEKLASLVTKTFTNVRDSDLLSSQQQNNNNNEENNNNNNNNNNKMNRRQSISSVNSSSNNSTSLSLQNQSQEDSATLATIRRLLTAGIGLCRRHAQKIDPNELRQAWFTLLDLFAKPKRSFQKRIDIVYNNVPSSSSSPNINNNNNNNKEDFPELSIQTGDLLLSSSSTTTSKSTTTLQLSSVGIQFHISMLKFFLEHSTIVLAHMVQALDLKEVIQKIVQDSEQESYASLKPVIVGILDLLRFELTSNDLCRMCACNDVVHLTDELHHLLGRAMQLKGVFCWLCQGHLRRHQNDTDNARIFNCGHAFHESCIQGGQSAECPQCVEEKTNVVDAATRNALMKQLQKDSNNNNNNNNNNKLNNKNNNKKPIPSSASNDEEQILLLDPQRCLRRLKIVRQKLDVALRNRTKDLSTTTTKNNNNNNSTSTSTRVLILSPPSRFGTVLEQDQPTSTDHMASIETTSSIKSVFPKGAYVKISHVPPQFQKEEKLGGNNNNNYFNNNNNKNSSNSNNNNKNQNQTALGWDD